MPTEIAQPAVYVIAGPNGAGKTTFATSFLPGFVNCREFVNADLIAAGLSPFDPDSQAVAAGRLMLLRIDELVCARQSFGFETTLAGRIHARRLTSMKSEAGYRVVLFFLWLETDALAISRVAFRVREGGHHIPPETVKRRFRLGLRNFGSLYRNLADDWYIIDGSKATPSIVGRGSSAGIEILDSERLDDICSISGVTAVIHKTDNDMIARVNAALCTAMAGLICRARLRDVPLIVSEHGEVVEVNPHELQLPSLPNEQPEQPTDRSSRN